MNVRFCWRYEPLSPPVRTALLGRNKLSSPSGECKPPPPRAFQRLAGHRGIPLDTRPADPCPPAYNTTQPSVPNRISLCQSPFLPTVCDTQNGVSRGDPGPAPKSSLQGQVCRFHFPGTRRACVRKRERLGGASQTQSQFFSFPGVRPTANRQTLLLSQELRSVRVRNRYEEGCTATAGNRRRRGVRPPLDPGLLSGKK